MRQAFDLPIELVKGESSTQVQSHQAGFNISPQCFQTGDETSGVDSTCSVHPVDHFSLRQCVRDPMFSNTPHALAFASRSGQLVELTAYRLKSLRINSASSLNQARIRAQRWLLFLHVNHRVSVGGVIYPYEDPLVELNGRIKFKHLWRS